MSPVSVTSHTSQVSGLVQSMLSVTAFSDEEEMLESLTRREEREERGCRRVWWVRLD